MRKNIYEIKEDQVFNRIKKIPWFKSKDLVELMESERMGYLYLKRWVKSGRVKRYPFNIYSPVNLTTGKANINLHEAVCQLHANTYLCNYTAARLYGCVVPEENCIYLATEKRFRELSYDGWDIKYKRYLPIEECVSSNLKKYSSYTQTVIEIINTFPKNMTWQDLLKFIDSLNCLETSRVLKVLEGINNKTLYKKLGWLVDVGLIDVDYKETLIEYCLKQSPVTKFVFCPEAQEDGVYNERWRLWAPKQ